MTEPLENLLRSLRDPECILQLDPDGNLLEVNETGLSMLEATDRADVVARNLWERVHPNDRENVKHHVLATLNGAQGSVDFRLNTFQNNELWLNMRSALRSDIRKDNNQIVALLRDITQERLLQLERESAVKALQESESRFEVAFHSSPVALVLATFDRRYVEANEEFCKLVGYSREEVIGRNVADLNLVTPAEREELARNLITAGGVMRNVEFRLRIKDGSIRNVLYSVETITLHGIPHHLATFIDITERKTLETQFLRAQRMESIGTLASGIAHDLNNLLSPIVMGVELIRQVEPSEKLKPILKTIEDSSKRGTHLVQQVLSFARGVEGARIPIQLDGIVREVESIVHKTFPKSISFESHSTEGLQSVVGDPTQLNQVLLNLCVNARDAMEQGGLLKVTTRNRYIDEAFKQLHGAKTAGPHVELSVQDEGTGMDKDVIEHVFEPFFTTKERGKGTGLGLSSVAGIVRSHGGFVTVESRLGKGSKFSIFLPAKSAQPAPDPLSSDSIELPRGRGETILLVDDEASILSITRQMLESYGYRVLTADKGAAALKIIEDNPSQIDLVLTDLMMPGMDGYALISALRERNMTLPVIAASGLTSEDRTSRSKCAGADYFLAKPYAVNSILSLIREALSSDNKA
ncbi:MAG: PAS domain S-box protein [Opitutales bacterium]|nr:PAS domain S-box protein [Opitutales bacterium]